MLSNDRAPSSQLTSQLPDYDVNRLDDAAFRQKIDQLLQNQNYQK